MTIKSIRLASIDVLRALTMFLMIFVNDLWTLIGIPKWLEHVDVNTDGMGLADTVFPAFLFIVGLSIPFAVENRLKKGDSTFEILKHIAIRSLALLIIGFFHVNLETYNPEAILSKPIWEILITIAFFLIWLAYPKDFDKRKKTLLQGTGILMLIILAAIYKGGDAAHPSWMTHQWWGILGLIGWAYLLCSSIHVLCKGNVVAVIISLIALIAINSAFHLNYIPKNLHFWLMGDGSNATLVMGGILAGLIYKKNSDKNSSLWLLLGGFALVMFIYGFSTRPLWGISKLRSTPSWTTICSGITLIAFMLLIWLVDIKGKENWFNSLKPAGTATLTAYLLPYIHYPIFTLIGWQLPEILRTGGIGIIKCLLYSLIIILITGWLEKRKIKLKL
ncbi:DUF5009 domain-containing protein [Solitalea sp. MAHUQ-68]|uniref:DUF5009 domain-containing protein n=1 Tax=Solitalea agri TaxID=2953739 RepID=A0A9X2F5T5_9SPHI|nr:DUF5009 domain-containing protein [Solitalea agri]MCO4294694.1 DUF5009 domain-containing protein [Solitalea agri]